MTSRRSFAYALGALAAVSAAALSTLAVTPEGPPAFQITKFTIDSGGGTLAGGVFEVTGTIGQPDAECLAGASYELSGGFWGVPKFCPQDTTGDGTINVLDLVEVLICFGQPDTPPCDTGQDINRDGTIDVLDLIELLLAFGTVCP